LKWLVNSIKYLVESTIAILLLLTSRLLYDAKLQDCVRGDRLDFDYNLC